MSAQTDFQIGEAWNPIWRGGPHQYHTLEECYVLEAQKYLERAADYRNKKRVAEETKRMRKALFMEQCAKGCERKARKKIAKARDLCALLYRWD